MPFTNIQLRFLVYDRFFTVCLIRILPRDVNLEALFVDRSFMI